MPGSGARAVRAELGPEDDGRRARMRSLLAEIERGDTCPDAMRERFGCTVTEARAALPRGPSTKRTLEKNERKRTWGRVKGLWMRPEIEAALVAHGKRCGGQGRALAVAMRLLEAVAACHSRGAVRVVVELVDGEPRVRPLEPLEGARGGRGDRVGHDGPLPAE